MHEVLWLLLLVPVYGVARYLKPGSAGWFVLVAWVATSLMWAGGLWIGLTGALATVAIGFLFRERLELKRFFKKG
jgi:hypothetical protein